MGVFAFVFYRLEELHVIDIAFLHGCQVPTIVFIYQVCGEMSGELFIFQLFICTCICCSSILSLVQFSFSFVLFSLSYINIIEKNNRK